MKIVKLVAVLSFLLISVHGIGQISTNNYSLQPGTISYRIVGGGVDPTPPANYTNTYYGAPSGAMTSWNSSQYGEGHLEYDPTGASTYNYRLLFPVGYDHNDPYEYPMILMMHGAGESGWCWNSCYNELTDERYRNNDHNLLHGGKPHLDAVNLANGKKAEDPTLPNKSFPGFVLFPQNLPSSSQPGWVGNGFDAVARMVLLLQDSLNIDPNRIYVHGLSDGGKAAWKMVDRNPSIFAALLPMSATIGLNGVQYADMAHVPVWQFQGGIDGNPTPNSTIQVGDRLRAEGGSVLYTEYPGFGHGIWNKAYAEADFFPWMLRQNKSNIHVYFGDSTLCPTNSNGIKLGVSQGFLAYQWEQDGEIIQGATNESIIVTQPATYRVRFSRVSATPSESEWNIWSKPVVIKESLPVTPKWTTIGSPHLPGANGETSVTIKGVNTSGLSKNWYRNDILLTGTANTLDSIIRSGSTNAPGAYTLKTIPVNGCESLTSETLTVTYNSPITLAIPTNLQGQITSAGSVHLFWQDNSPNESGFEVYRATSPTGPWLLRAQLNEDIVAYHDAGLLPNAIYYYKIRAVSPTGKSNYTNNLQITPLADTEAPTPPQNLTQVSRTISSVSLSWTAATDNTGIAQYYIYYGSTVIPTGSTATTYNVTGLAANENFLFTVKAVDFSNNFSQPSNQLETTTGFNGLNYEHSTGAWNLLTEIDWSIKEITGTVPDFTIAPRSQEDFFNFRHYGYLFINSGGNYRFRTRSDDGSMLYLHGWFDGINFSTYRIVNHDGLHGNSYSAESANQSLSSSSSYPISSIYFERGGGQSLTVEYKGPDTNENWIAIPASALTSGSAPPLSPPNPPAGLVAASISMTSIHLDWTHLPPPPADFEIYRSTDNIIFNIIATSDVSEYIDNNLLPSTLYYYKVRSISTSGSSGFSAVTSATTQGDLVSPSVPANVTLLTNTYTNAGLTWDSSTDNVGVEGYKVFINSVLVDSTYTNTYFTTALLPETSYDFTISAYDASGNESAQSTIETVLTSTPIIFYSLPTGDLNQLSTWNSESDGSGTAPTSFTYNGQYYHINRTATLTNQWVIGGSISKVIIDDNVDLSLGQALNGNLRVGENSSLNINYQGDIVFDQLAATSTVTFNSYTSIPPAKYGNLILNDTGLKILPEGTVEIEGDLTLAAGVGIKGAPSNGTTVTLHGDLLTGASMPKASTDTRVSIHFAGNNSHTLDANSDLAFYQIATDTNGSAILNNTSGGPLTLTLGSLNGGGLWLADGSTLSIADNHLQLIWASNVNPNNTSGRISVSGGDISLTTSTINDANFYLTPGSNSVRDFTLSSSAGGTTFIREDLEITDGLKIKSGIINSSNHLIIKSSSSASASIEEIEGNGAIVGDVKVERFMAAGRQYRYISSPVSGLTVADWQNYFPITGNFTGTSTGAGLSTNPSMYLYDEPSGGWIEYPNSGSTNEVPIETGRGYSAFIRDNINPTTILGQGSAHQGSIPFGLTGGTGSSLDGWNLIGNPYASDVVWNTTDWTSSGISNVIYVTKNTPGGASTFMTWDRSTNTGTLENGKIPSGQAFWVQAINGSPSLTVNESAKTTESALENTEFYRTGTPEISPNVFSVELRNEINVDATFINFRKEGNDAYDKLNDGVKRPNTFFEFSTKSIDGVSLVVNSLSDEFCSKNIEVVLNNTEPGHYTLKFDHIDSFQIGLVTLEDKLLGETIQVSQNGFEYELDVTSNTSTFQNRFVLHINRPDLLTEKEITTETPAICKDESLATITIENSQVGVVYEAVNTESIPISDQFVGNGGLLQIDIPTNQMNVGANKIFAKAYFPGCNAVLLDDATNIDLQDPIVNQSISNLQFCIGDEIEIGIETTEDLSIWYDVAYDTAYTISGNKLTTQPLKEYNAFHVFSLSSNGCVSRTKALIEVFGVTNTKPEIEINGPELSTESAFPVQWLLDNNPIPEATEQRYLPSVSGNYSVMSINGSCIVISEAINTLITKTDDAGNEKFSVSVFPNPVTTQFFNIKGTTPYAGEISVELVDTMGRTHRSQVISNEELHNGISFQKPSPGIYFIRIKQGRDITFLKLLAN